MMNCETLTNISFDILAAVISLSDIATDVIVTYNFYQDDRLVFFGLSLTFIILAQLSYVFAFIIEIGYETRPHRVFLMFLCLLPLSPIISFVFYLTEDPDSWTAKRIKKHFCFDVSFHKIYVDQNKSKLRQWMKKKLRKHLGFIMEALIEAFPQSILQITAIVIYNEASIVSIISILISMLSVSSKTFIFSIQFSMNIKTLLFNWLCVVTDFVGIFFAVSWVFYHAEFLAIIGFIWKLKILICIVPLVFCFSIACYYEGLRNLLNAIDSSSVISGICGAFCAWLMVTILWAFGMILGTLALEISTFVLFAGPMFLVGSVRVPTTAEKNKLWLDILQWIKSAHSQNIDNLLSLTKKQDKILRICIINKTIIEQNHDKLDKFDEIFVKFINDNAKDCYMNVKSLYELRVAHKSQDVSDGAPPSFLKIFGVLLCIPYYMAKSNLKHCSTYDKSKAKIVLYYAIFINFVCGPFYYLSRIFNMLFPFIILINLYINGYNIFGGHVDVFQLVMLLIYLIFIFSLIILGIAVASEQYLLWHIMPGEQIDSSYKPFSVTKAMIETKYSTMITIPVRDALLHRKFGFDIANIIIDYCTAIQQDK